MSSSAKAAANKTSAASECVQVIIRCRPLSSTEVKNGNSVIVSMDRAHHTVSVAHPSSLNGGTSSEQPRTFTMDAVYDESLSQQVLYDETCHGIVSSVLNGYNGTIFAYGQTGESARTTTPEQSCACPMHRIRTSAGMQTGHHSDTMHCAAA